MLLNPSAPTVAPIGAGLLRPSLWQAASYSFLRDQTDTSRLCVPLYFKQQGLSAICVVFDAGDFERRLKLMQAKAERARFDTGCHQHLSRACGGKDAPVVFGLGPRFVGLLQVNVQVPDLPDGDYPVVVTIGGVASNSGLLHVVRP